ncbi:Hypothetical predicted protein [Podarcis lilfordi]|uniref:Uncharacterized protein n=1 Tax=Podarcis lilfordi TaxID=74358 RepID=A0AA35NWV3_9SAUR|nr:Hypothetical predicted protein [Podarcis lilfordi]
MQLSCYRMHMLSSLNLFVMCVFNLKGRTTFWGPNTVDSTVLLTFSLLPLYVHSCAEMKQRQANLKICTKSRCQYFAAKEGACESFLGICTILRLNLLFMYQTILLM